jgi:hypothetical protein
MIQELLFRNIVRRVRARRFDFLSVHSDFHFFPNSRFQVTHIRSQKAVRVAMCCKASAIGLAKALKGFDWDFTLPRTWDYRKDKFPARVRKSMKEAEKASRSWRCPVHDKKGATE